MVNCIQYSRTKNAANTAVQKISRNHTLFLPSFFMRTSRQATACSGLIVLWSVLLPYGYYTRFCRSCQPPMKYRQSVFIGSIFQRGAQGQAAGVGLGRRC